MSSSIDRPREPGDPPADEIHIGRLKFVPSLRARPNDPWAHRKGEPRVFALLWAAYLMGGAMLTLFAARSLGTSGVRQYRFGAVELTELLLLGVVVLWPATRFSQTQPRRPIRATLMDLVAILLPVQAALWPTPLLARWPLEVAMAMAAWTAVWAVLIGALVARGVTMATPMGRTLMMGVVLGVVGGVPALALLVGVSPLNDLGGVLAWASPFTGVLAITRGPENLRVDIDAGEWAAIGWVAAVGLVAWVVVAPWWSTARRETGAPPPPGWGAGGESGRGRVAD